MAINTYDVGDMITLSALFKNALGAAADPTDVSLKIKTPDGTTTTIAEISLANSAVGTWTYNYTITQEGKHFYRFTGTGAVVSAEENLFMVRESSIL